MPLDQIWKQQLSLVSYGNEFLAGHLNLSDWIEHAIFNQHGLIFRDLQSQQLLAQHFQIWLEGLKQQGVNKLSLHLSSLLNDEKNPNPNVELLPFAHFIVSHQAKQKTAWICGLELPQWDTHEQEFTPPHDQQNTLTQTTFWRYGLNDKFSKKINADLNNPNWNDINQFMQTELFQHQYAAQFFEPPQYEWTFYGYDIDHIDISKQHLAIIPSDYPADLAHQLLHRSLALVDYLQEKQRHPYDDTGGLIRPEEQINLRNFAQKTDDLLAKLIVKTANHYQTAQIIVEEEIIDRTMETLAPSDPAQQHKVDASSVIKLILLIVIICICAYYFGL
ncbi:MAG: hypothetical protein KA331_02385 [Acinetobacter sp.]|nr:hypothetical protein [Acinetobacter sp.]MBP6352649.1 hypothetical protein [Acinetobacter sp.]MBP7217321.1 hypothetical protein [Acinetobacter sp.]